MFDVVSLINLGHKKLGLSKQFSARWIYVFLLIFKLYLTQRRVKVLQSCVDMHQALLFLLSALLETKRNKMKIKQTIRAQLYGLGYPRQPSPRATLAEVTFSLFLSKIQPAVYIRIANSSRGARQLGWASCLTSAGRVTLASGTTFLHISALARLTGTSLGVANVT